jgi:hypothetical protein
MNMTDDPTQLATPPTDEEISQAASILRRLSPGSLPLDIFLETARLTTTPIIELVPLRTNDGKTEVLLFKRAEDDPTWPGQFHTPGTVIRSTDASTGIQAPLSRIYIDALQVKPDSQPRYVTSLLHKVARGSEMATVFYIDMSEADSTQGVWYPADQLPDSIVATQLGFIADAVAMFEGEKA